MRNDLQVKVTWTKNKENIDALYFDYFNRKSEYVGSIIVDATGKIEWHIINATYQNNIFNIISYINGTNNKWKLDDVSKKLNLQRWERARLFIANSGLYLNYRRKLGFLEEEGKVLMKRIK